MLARLPRPPRRLEAIGAGIAHPCSAHFVFCRPTRKPCSDTLAPRPAAQDESEDMDQEGVYLLGEDRWERPERVSAGHREN